MPSCFFLSTSMTRLSCILFALESNLLVMIRIALPLFAFLLVSVSVPAQSNRYSDVQILIPDGETVNSVLDTYSVDLDHFRVETTEYGEVLRAVLQETEWQRIQSQGLAVTVIDPDLALTLAQRPPFTEAEREVVRQGGRIEGNVLGSLQGHPTFDEMVDILDDMRAQFPELISERTSIGQTIEGREIWLVEISDNPGIDEGEGEVLYTAMHHAREPTGMVTVLYYMWYLLEQYETNSEIASLINSRRMYFVPVLNPDGYVFNELLESDGQWPGWRKNCRVNDTGGVCCTLSTSGTCGVDLNRNYGYLWGYDNDGSSPNSWSETYRGEEPFSEPETVAIRDFLELDHNVTQAFNYHTYGGLLLYPWGYEDGAYTPDDAQFQAQSIAMTAVNNYVWGTGPDVLYKVNGDSDDWMYGEQGTKPKILSYTPEVGYDFWPDPKDIISLADENLEANILLAEYAVGVPTGLVDEAIETPNGFVLGANYPNPFNPHTQIPFVLTETSHVTLSVVDMLGRTVATLADGQEQPGSHVVRFDATNLPSGVYSAVLEINGISQARQLILLK